MMELVARRGIKVVTDLAHSPLSLLTSLTSYSTPFQFLSTTMVSFYNVVVLAFVACAAGSPLVTRAEKHNVKVRPALCLFKNAYAHGFMHSSLTSAGARASLYSCSRVMPRRKAPGLSTVRSREELLGWITSPEPTAFRRVSTATLSSLRSSILEMTRATHRTPSTTRFRAITTLWVQTTTCMCLPYA